MRGIWLGIRGLVRSYVKLSITQCLLLCSPLLIYHTCLPYSSFPHRPWPSPLITHSWLTLFPSGKAQISFGLKILLCSFCFEIVIWHMSCLVLLYYSGLYYYYYYYYWWGVKLLASVDISTHAPCITLNEQHIMACTSTKLMNCTGMQDSSWARCPQMEGQWKKKKKEEDIH
jgi:hypothetical protein